MAKGLTIGFILLGIIFSVCLAQTCNGPNGSCHPDTVYSGPITVDLEKLPDDVDCSYGKGDFHYPDNSVGLVLLQTADGQYENPYSDNSTLTNEINPNRTEGFAYPLGHKVKKYWHPPRNYPLGVGVAGEIYSDRAYFFGGTTDEYAYENLIAGLSLANTFPEIYSFLECKCGWELRGTARQGFAFATANQYTFPACNAARAIYCNQQRKKNGYRRTQCHDYPISNLCGTKAIVLFGGTNGTNFHNRILFYSPKSGLINSANVTYNGVTPEELKLAGHSSFIAGDSLYIVGGLRQVKGVVAPVFSNQIYRFNLNIQEWSRVTTSNTTLPAIAFQTSTQYGAFNPINAYIYGGLLSTGTINQILYLLSITPATNTYTLSIVNSPLGGNCKPATFGHSAEVNSGNIYFYGGSVLNTVIVNTIFPSDGQPTILNHFYLPSVQLWKYNIPNNQWVNLTQIHPYLDKTNALVMLEYNDELLFFGGMNPSYGISTGVFRLAVGNPTYVTRPCCAPGYEGKNCEIPICSNNCGGPLIGKCVAPDTCQCYDGFYGNDCSQHTCSSQFNQNLIALNDVLFYPKAAKNILDKIDQILARLRFFRDNLRPWKSDTLVTKYDVIAQQLNSFNLNNLDTFFNELQDEVQSLLQLRQ